MDCVLAKACRLSDCLVFEYKNFPELTKYTGTISIVVDSSSDIAQKSPKKKKKKKTFSLVEFSKQSLVLSLHRQFVNTFHKN